MLSVHDEQNQRINTYFPLRQVANLPNAGAAYVDLGVGDVVQGRVVEK